jgi:hypothetical protein
MTKIDLLFVDLEHLIIDYRLEVGRWTNVERHNRLCQLCSRVVQKKNSERKKTP